LVKRACGTITLRKEKKQCNYAPQPDPTLAIAGQSKTECRVTAVFERTYSAFLLDMDGTILTSIASAERVWTRWAECHGLDPASFLPTIHGVRSIDTIRRLGLPGVDPEAEADRITQEEIADVSDIEPIVGAAPFLASIPLDRWAIVTSAPRELAEARIRAAALPLPPILITAEDIERGKPSPDGYLDAAKRLGFAPTDCLVFEDAPVGVQAGRAAGADVLMITQSHSLPTDQASLSVRDYTHLRVTTLESGMTLRST
jgi:mannitol-1-/sugar-/sorbitol-6-phosphatase